MKKANDKEKVEERDNNEKVIELSSDEDKSDQMNITDQTLNIEGN